ncbi:MAG: hypothetical protein ACQEP3_00075 [Patescibacteria group bacterium]
MKKENNSYYIKQKEETIRDVEQILKKLDISKKPQLNEFEDLFNQTTNEVVESWRTNRKYCRTVFIQKAFREKFPQDYLRFSLSIDVMVNILDDFLDEELSDKKKKNYVIEFLRNFSFYNYQNSPRELTREVGLYMNKLITLAFSEKQFQEQIKKFDNLKKIIDDSVDLLKLRSMDIDIFTKIALINIKQENEKIIRMSRLFRSLNILKKDIVDIPHDRKNNMESVVTIVLDKGINFDNYINKVTNKKIRQAKDNLNKSNIILANFYKMIEEEKNDIDKLVNSL